MALKHSDKCKCVVCQAQPDDLVAESYQTETATIKAETIHFSITGWWVDYSITSRHGRNFSTMPIATWNRQVKKWQQFHAEKKEGTK